MDRIDTLLGSDGGSTISREEGLVEQTVREEQSSNTDVGSGSSPEVSSCPNGADLELGLGLSLGGGGNSGFRVVNSAKQFMAPPRILTAKDLRSPGPITGDSNLCPSMVSSFSSSSSSSSRGLACENNFRGFSSAGTKRAADSMTSPPGASSSHVVGWPPVRAYRMNSLSNRAKSLATGDYDLNAGVRDGNSTSYIGNVSKVAGDGIKRPSRSFFVKVNMDGVGIGRKIDLSLHSCYESLAQTLEEMFAIPSEEVDSSESKGEHQSLISKAKRKSSLLDGSSDLMLAYEDKDGDWMLVGDVPWGLFLGSVKRLRIMKASEANGFDMKF